MSPKAKYTPPVKKRKSNRPAVSTTRSCTSMPPAAAPTGEHHPLPANAAVEIAVMHADLPGEMRRVGIVSGIVLAVMAILWLLVR
jgi:hypothetical protein